MAGSVHELVKIERDGSAQAIGERAVERMQVHQGYFRLFASPPHVVFMRYVGADGRRDAEDGAVVRIAGEVNAPAALYDIVSMIGNQGWSGELSVFCGDDVRSIYVSEGNIRGVRTNVADERLGTIIYRFGGLDKAQHQAVMDLVRSGSRFGDAAVGLGFVSHEDVYHYLGRQIEEITFAALAVNDGTYFFLEEFKAAEMVSQHSIGCNQMLLSAVTRMDEIKYFRQRIPSEQHVPFKTQKPGLPPSDYLETFDAVDGLSNVTEIGRRTGLGEFETTKALYALVQTGHLAIRAPRTVGGERALVELANQVLRGVHQRAAAAGKQQQLRDSLRNFLEGAGVYPIIFRDAGPDDQGLLDAERIADNVTGMTGADPELFLKRQLNDYVSFGLFSLGAMLGRDAEAEVSGEAAAILALLQPRGQ